MELFAFDVDGTLVSGDRPLTPLDISEMNYHLSRGDAICIASGRPVSGGLKYLNLLTDSPFRYVVGSNGSVVKDIKGETIYRKGLTYSDFLRIYKYFASPERSIYCYIEDDIGYFDYTFVVDEEYRWNQMRNKIDFNSSPLPLDDYITKIVVCSKPEDSSELEKNLDKYDLAGMRTVRSSPVFLEFVNPTADKAEGVAALAEKLNIEENSIHTFGDAMNDYLMVKRFDGTAMGNAVPEVKAVAKRVTKTVDEDGVGYALKAWFHK